LYPTVTSNDRTCFFFAANLTQTFPSVFYKDRWLHAFRKVEKSWKVWSAGETGGFFRKTADPGSLK